MNPVLHPAHRVTVANFWAEVYPALEVRDKRELIDRYARFLSTLAAAEPDRALPTPDMSFITMTSAGAAFCGPDERDGGRVGRQRLAPLLAWFWVATSRTERFRFMRAYAGHNVSLRSWDLSATEEAALTFMRANWNGMVLSACRGGDGFRVGQQAGFAVWQRDDAATDAALASLLPDPDQAFVGARICKPGSRNHTARVELAGRAYLLKRYNCRGWLYRLQNTLRPSRAVKNWALLHHFQLRGIPVPKPSLCLEERRCRLLGRAYILMDFCPGETLRQLWPVLSAPERHTLVASLATILGRMHRFGLLHGDLKWDNIVVWREAGEQTIRLIDFDGARQVRSPSRRRANKDLSRFLRDLRSNDPGGYWEARFIRSWSAWMAHL